MANVTLNLMKPVEVFGKRVASVELKEPSGGLYVRLGDPRVLVFNASGSAYWVEQAPVIGEYFDKLVLHDAGGGAIMALLSLEDAMAAKEVLFGFFSDAASRLAARKSTASSLASAS
jgi:hypothetical protein